jgi:O-antigen/teichoic acid export membrane protein|tara:strand:+ start:704 stop:2185 length:1482 start_codon:yes stop_codon:yes gene_type:complete
MVFAEHKKRILKDTSLYSLANFLVQFVGIVTAIVIRRALGPTLVGVWELLKIVLSYSMYSDMGVSTVAYRDIPFHVGQQNEQEAVKAKNTCFFYTITVSLLMSALLIAGSMFRCDGYPREIIVGLRVIGLILVMTSVYNFYILLMRAYKNFVVLSQTIVINAVLVLVFTVILVPRFKIYGMYMAISVALLICCIYIFIRTKYTFRLTFDLEKLKYMIRTGAPMLLSGIGFVLLISVDKLMIAKYLGFEEVGFYTIASMATITLITVPKSFSIVVFPSMQEHYGRVENIAEIKSYLFQPIKLIVYFMPFFIGISYFIVPVLVSYVLPEYVPGIIAFKILMGGVFFVCVAYPSSIFMLTINKQVRLAVLVFISVAISVLMVYFSIQRGLSLQGVALSMSISYFIYFILITVDSLHRVSGFKENCKVLLIVFGSFLYFLIIVLCIEKFIVLESSILNMFMHIVVFILANGVFLIFVRRKQVGALFSEGRISEQLKS